MKSKVYSGFLVALLGLASCSQEDYTLVDPGFSSSDLTEGKSYSVSINPETNEVTLQNLMGSNYLASWVTPQGMAKGNTVTFSLPFAGSYEVTFGVMTKGGLVYAEPYTFNLSNNNFSLLSDEIWTNLAGGVDENGNGNPKTWVPMNQKYGNYHGSAPVTYMSPDDVLNNGTGVTDLKIGTDNWCDNWDPGFQSWLIDSDNPYMDSEMTFYLDAQKGSVAEITRCTENGPQQYTTNFNLNVVDIQRPLISFNSGDMLHATWGDGVCDNYSQELKIIECTPYVLQIATMRTNSEGPWWIVWNFVAKELKEDPSILPSEGPELVEVVAPELPKYSDLATTLFTIEGDATYYASETTLIMNDEKPYDVMYWNGSNGGSWEWVEGYGSSWAPSYPEYDEFALTLSRKSDGSYLASLESAEGSQTSAFTIGENTITFDEGMHFLTAGNQVIEGKEFTVLVCSPDDEQVVLGIPDGYDSSNKVNRYLCVNLNIKPIGGGSDGPTLITGFDNSKLTPGSNSDRNGQIECALYHPWGGTTDFFADNSKLKFKKDQTMSCTFKLSGIKWKEGATPRAYVGCNEFGNSWDDPNRFNESYATPINLNGETTISIVNNTGATFSFVDKDCFSIILETTPEMVEGPLGDNGFIDASQVTIEVTQVAIQ